MDSISYPEFSRIYNGLQKESNQLYRLLPSITVFPTVSAGSFMCCGKRPPLTQTELCNTLYLSKQTVNSRAQISGSGWLYPSECASGNRRSKNIHLTEAGLALAMRTVDNVFKMEERALRLSASERAAILSLGKTPEPAARGGMQAFIRKIF